MDQVLTPHRHMIPRSETMLSPPPLKRQRVRDDDLDVLLNMSPTSLPMSLMIPDNLDTPELPVDLWQDQENIPRIALKRRTTLSPSSTPILKRKIADIPSPSSDFLSLSKPTDAPPMRMKRRRSSISSCGADSYGRFEVTPLMSFV